jgi:SAM-dependent methyltransferase
VRDEASTGEDVVAGRLECAACPQVFPIVRGVPRFPATEERTLAAATRRTQGTYTFAWRRFGEKGVAGAWEKDSYRYTAMIPGELTAGAGRLGLDAGCGAGHDLLRMAEGGAEIIGLDLSEGVETARRLTAHLPNVHLVQGDLNRPPFRADLFDFVYSFGVLHHLPDPLLGFRNLARLLKPGGVLITYVYEDFVDRSALERAILSGIRGLRRLTSRMPSPLLYGLCCAGAPVVWATCSVPAQCLRAVAPALADRIPFRHTLRWNVLASDLFDRFAVPVEWRYSREGVQALYRGAGLDVVETRRYRGWVSWGWRPAIVGRTA